MPADPATGRAERIAVLLPSLEGGGAERSMLNLVRGFLARGRAVDLVLCQAKGSLLGQEPEGATLVTLAATPGLAARLIATLGDARLFSALLRPVLLAKKTAPEIARLRSLQRYLTTRRPSVLLSALPYANLVALWARDRAGSSVPVVASERIAIHTYCTAPANVRKWRWRYAPELIRRTYPGAAAVVTVSRHAAEELTGPVGLAPDNITTIYNPVVDDTLRARAREPLAHPWFSPGAAPVILAAGRLTEQKDFATLLRAFAIVRAERPARLVILGEGRLQAELEALAATLGVGEDVDMPGFVDNPFQYMSRSSVFVLSSEYEGLPGVLIQAMACACPVISTDCPGGSREILAEGRYGALTRMGDEREMARAILAELKNPTDRELLLARAEDFSVDRGVDNYLALLDAIVSRAADRQ